MTKFSVFRPFAQERMSRGFLTGGAAALTMLIAACGGGGNGNTCHNLPKATNVIGQADFTSGSVNRGGAVGAGTVASPVGSVASNGTLFYVPDTGNSRILGFSSIPASAGASANFALGQNDLTSSGATTSATGLAFPAKVAVVNNGSKLVVTDTKNNRVLIWNSLPTSNTQPDVVIGQTDLVTSTSGTCDSSGLPSKLMNPTAAVIGGNYLAVADQGNNRVLIWNDVSTLTTGQAADVVVGQATTVTNNGVTTSVDTPCTSNTSVYNQTFQKIGLSAPTDVWTDGFQLFVVDSGNNRVLYWSGVPTSNTQPTYVIGQSGSSSTTAFSTSGYGTSATTLKAPQGVFVDSGNIYVADTGNNRVLVYSGGLFGNGTAATGVWGQADFDHGAYNDDDQDGVPGDQQNNQSNTNPTNDTLHSPSGVFAFNGNVYVTDSANQRVLTFTAGSAVNGSDKNACN